MTILNTDQIPKALQKKGLPDRLKEICEANNIVFMGLFGSYARQEQTKKSDIDIAIEFSPGSKKTLFDLVGLEDRLRSLFNRKVDLGIYSSINPHVKEQIRKEICVLYEKR